MTAAVGQALTLWGMPQAQAELAARRENTVWHVTHRGRAFALRVHRPGYRTGAELNSELQWMAALAEGGLSVPAPVAQPDGTLIGRVGAHHVSLLEWMDGRPIGAIGALHDIPDPQALCRELGRQMARLHDLSDAWQPLPGFTRPDWRRAGLLGDDPLWGRFWEHPHLDRDQRALLQNARAAADDALAGIETEADQGLIHADLLAENILIDKGRLSFIDFDDGACGFRDFELATFLLKFIDAPDYPQMRAALCEGYAVRRCVDPYHLDLFLLLRGLTYPGWIMARLDEPGATARSERALATALTLSETHLKRRSA